MSGQNIKGIHYKSGKPIKIEVQDGLINRITPLTASEYTGNTILAPGLVDLQINGYKGKDYNTLPIKDGLIIESTCDIFAEGVTSYYPTVITNSAEAIEQAVSTIATQCKQDSLTDQAVQGIHVEGPFISAEDGPRGAHAKQYVQAPDWEMFCRWQEAAEGRIKIITLSPEWPGSAEFIRKCAETGVIVSIGHSAASPEQIREAVEAGASMSTHFGNGAHLMLPRHPNYLWEQLAQDGLWTCLIGDGFHLPESVLKVAMAVKQEKALLVSDAVYLAGMAPGKYETHIGGNVVLTEEGKLHTAENDKILAGSAQMLPWGIGHVTSCGLVDLATALEMSSLRPAKLMGLAVQAGLSEGAPADFISVANDGGQFEIRQTYKAGELVYEKK